MSIYSSENIVDHIDITNLTYLDIIKNVKKKINELELTDIEIHNGINEFTVELKNENSKEERRNVVSKYFKIFINLCTNRHRDNKSIIEISPTYSEIKDYTFDELIEKVKPGNSASATLILMRQLIQVMCSYTANKAIGEQAITNAGIYDMEEDDRQYFNIFAKIRAINFITSFFNLYTDISEDKYDAFGGNHLKQKRKSRRRYR